MATRKTPYDPAKRYALVLAQVVQLDGFTIRPGPTPGEAPAVSGAFANRIAAEQPDAIVEARELAPEPEAPEAPSQVHEDADGVVTVVNAAR